MGYSCPLTRTVGLAKTTALVLWIGSATVSIRSQACAPAFRAQHFRLYMIGGERPGRFLGLGLAVIARRRADTRRRTGVGHYRGLNLIEYGCHHSTSN
jgi:hypothetical protein